MSSSLSSSSSEDDLYKLKGFDSDSDLSDAGAAAAAAATSLFSPSPWIAGRPVSLYSFS